jgi:hypothetical protein
MLYLYTYILVPVIGLQDLQKTMDEGRSALEESEKNQEIAKPDLIRKKKTHKVCMYALYVYMFMCELTPTLS